VLSGFTQKLRPEVGLTEREIDEGWVLGCVRAAESDTIIEISNLENYDIPESRIWPCRIAEINRLASDVLQVFLRLPPSAEFRFIPGQYINIIGKDGKKRSYSVASAGSENKKIEIHVRAVKNGAMSNFWFNQAKVNDLLRFCGPLGTFFLRETRAVDIFFLATGTGIAPIKSMLLSFEKFNQDKFPNSITILWGGRQLTDLYFDIYNILGAHTYVPVLSQPSKGWCGFKGYVQDALIALHPNFMNARVYACGSDSMIKSSRNLLINKGLMPEHFYSDAFVSSGEY
jgi:CDP-4-dehydro-6-deoxyglucose reductase